MSQWKSTPNQECEESISCMCPGCQRDWARRYGEVSARGIQRFKDTGYQSEKPILMGKGNGWFGVRGRRKVGK